MQLVSVGPLTELYIPPPSELAVFPLNVQLVTVGLPTSLDIPPPKLPAVFPLKAQLVTVGKLLLQLYIPPPFVPAVFPLKVQLVTVGLLTELYIPPPSELAVFPLNLQLVTVGLVPELYIPPPRGSPSPGSVPVPPVIVNPSRTVLGPSPLTHLTTLSFKPVASIVVTFGPPELRTMIALPLKLIVSKYVPGATTTSSPLVEASIADWIVGY